MRGLASSGSAGRGYVLAVLQAKVHGGGRARSWRYRAFSGSFGQARLL